MKRIDWLGVEEEVGLDGVGEVVDAKKGAGRPVRRLLHQSRRESMVVWAVCGNGDGTRVLTRWGVVQGWGGGRS